MVYTKIHPKIFFGFGEEDFYFFLHYIRPLLITIFDVEVILLLQCKFQLKLPNGLGGCQKLVFKMAAVATILDSDRQNFIYF